MLADAAATYRRVLDIDPAFHRARLALTGLEPPNAEALAVSPDDRRIAFATWERPLAVHDAAGELIWSRKEHGRFPEVKEIKQLVRDRIAPDRPLGHSDRS